MFNNTNHLARLLTFIGSLLTIATLAALFAEINPQLQLISQLRVQLALGLLLIVLPLLFMRWQFALIFTIPLLINCAHFLPLYFSPPTDDATQAIARLTNDSLTITHVNIDRDKVDMLSKLNAKGSDIVFIQEVQPPIVDALATAMPNYEVVLVESRWDTRGSALLVRKRWEGELLSAEYLTITTYGDRPLAHALIRLNDAELSLLSLHVTRPENPLQAVEFADVAQWSKAQQASGRAVLIIGDFNQTPWSARFHNLLADGDLRNGQRGFGLQTTWPANLPAFLRIPIDLTVHSDDIRIVEREVGENWGGDHRPIHVKIQN